MKFVAGGGDFEKRIQLWFKRVDLSTLVHANIEHPFFGKRLFRASWNMANLVQVAYR